MHTFNKKNCPHEGKNALEISLVYGNDVSYCVTALLICQWTGFYVWRTILRALAKDSMATASFPGVRLARSDTALAISISEQPGAQTEASVR